MRQEPERGYLILADISGYTSYLAGVELEHAQDVLTELLELIVERFRPLLSIVKLEGDAVFAHVPGQGVPRPELLLELLESTYLAFRDRVASIRRNTTCDCNACRAIPSLDLKFILHYGEYLQQNVSGISELVGSDVNLAHRLLKNSVGEATGWRAYALFTEPGLSRMNLELENLHEQTEAYEHLGEIKTYSLDLHARYQELSEARREFVSPEEADQVIVREVAATPIELWEWLNDAEKRLRWESYEDIRPALRPGGRMGAGARNHCAHGKNVVLETVLDWRPFEYFTADYPMGIRTQQLEPTADGTRLNAHFRLKTRLPRWLRRIVIWFMSVLFRTEQQYDALVRLVAEQSDRTASPE